MLVPPDYESRTPEEKKAALLEVQDRLVSDGHFRRCPACVKPYVYAPDDQARIYGHVYSDAGIRETKLSGLCERCFDVLFACDDLSAEDGEP